MSNLEEIKKYSPAKLTAGQKEWYISFWAYDPASGKRKRKRLKLNHIHSIQERRRYAKILMIRINNKLAEGWNPWLESASSSAYTTLAEVVDTYRRYMDKMYADGNYREETHRAYISNLNRLLRFNELQKVPMTYIYQLDKGFIIRILDEIYLGRDNSPWTRDNYLSWAKSFCSWLVQKDYIKTSPVDGITYIAGRHKHKQRTIIARQDMDKLSAYLEHKNKHYLLAAYLLYYCFIRPKELALLKIEYISASRQTIFIPDSVSKNKKDGVVTLPKKVIELMIDIDIFSSPGSYYLFSDNFAPGANFRDSKCFRDFWLRYVRRELNFKSGYKFYSLKDTGITNMLRKYDVLSVRDQARHSSVLMTDTYTPHDLQSANDLIKNHEDDF